MLTSLRKAASTWVASIFIFLIAASFAVWGIGDMFRGGVNTTVISIGDSEITQDTYRTMFQNRISEVSRSLGRQLTFQEAQMLGVENQVLSQLLVDLTLQEDARDRGLNISDEAVGQLIVENPAFRGPNGQFSRQLFQQVINTRYGSEAALLAETRSEAVRVQIYSALTAGAEVSDLQLKLLNRYQNERRAIDYVTIDESNVSDVQEPSDEELAAYFEDRQTSYRAPESRTFSIIHLTEADVRDRIEVSDEDLERYYENNSGAFTNPERRTVLQLNFDDLQSAQQARQRIEEGATFEELAAERDLAERDYSLGTVTKGEMIDPTYADAAFSLESGSVSEAVEGRFGAALLKVTSIEGGETRTLDEVRDQLRTEIQSAQANAELLDVFDEVEDQRAGGASLEEAAKALNLPYRQITANASGADEEGNPVDIPNQGQVLNTVFEAEPADELDPLDAPGGFTWVHVDNVTPERPRELSEVRDQVIADWKAEELRQLLNERANEVVADLEAGTPMNEIANQLETSVNRVEDIAREGESPALPAPAVQAVFATPEGGFGSAPAAQSASRIVFRVADVSLTRGEPTQNLASQANARLSEDVILQYISQRQEQLGLEVNQTNRLRALGQAPQAE